MTLLSVLDTADVAMSLSADAYVGFMLRRADGAIRPVRYWRVGVQGESMVEFGLCQETGVILKLTTTQMHGEDLGATDLADLSALPTLRRGAPTCDQSAVPNPVNDEASALYIGHDSDSLWICFRPTEAARSLIACDRVRYVLDEQHRIVGVGFRELGGEELSQALTSRG